MKTSPLFYSYPLGYGGGSACFCGFKNTSFGDPCFSCRLYTQPAAGIHVKSTYSLKLDAHQQMSVCNS